MKILLFTHFKYPHLGGISSHMSILKRGLEYQKNNVDILSFSNLYLFGDIFVRVPSFILNKIKQGLGFYWRIKSITFIFNFILLFIFIFKKYDVINCQDVVAYNSTYLTRKIFGANVILTVHGYLKNEIKSENQVSFSTVLGFLKNVEKKAYLNAKVIISVDERIKEYILNNFKFSNNIVVLPNFVDINDFKPLINSNKLDNKKLRLFCPRRLVKKNGVIYAIKSMKFLPDFELIIAGEGPEKKNLEDYILKNKLNNVFFIGGKKYSEMINEYQKSDITLIPSITIANVEEATSISALESMACGVPVIASNVGGLKLLIKNNVNGFLVNQKSPKLIAKKVLELSQNQKLFNLISKNSRENVLKNYSHVAAAKKFIEVYFVEKDF
ncbi:MAG: glycosyltransferase family 4 protein [Candidatus ainarchaeum sp.]|nr:glycosyltransferase family 4 protein [Candidatus ainarchaeum sp.]